MNLFSGITEKLINNFTELIKDINQLDLDEKVHVINEMKRKLHSVSPFKNEPVDCVVWIKCERVCANDYNPNSVAPVEMQLLKVSILEDGYTQPIVAFKEKESINEENAIEVVDGFHRNIVGKESEEVKARIYGYLPVVLINENRTDKGDRIASTIRHNRARGKHKISAMSDIVLDLKRRNWSSEKIGRELGMDSDEVLRLAQITGIAEMFSDKEFSEAWEVGSIDESDTLAIEEENIDADVDKT